MRPSERDLAGWEVVYTGNLRRPLSEGVFFETPAGRELPEGLACVPDGKEVGGPHGEGHVTVYNTRDMAPEEFQAKLNSLDNKPTVKIKKGKVTKIECK